MNVIRDIISRFFMKFGNVIVQVFQKGSTYMIAVAITNVELRNDYKL
jgi:hypothetical protein